MGGMKGTLSTCLEWRGGREALDLGLGAGKICVRLYVGTAGTVGRGGLVRV